MAAYVSCRYYLKGPKVGTWETLIDNLPALVDNITPTRHTPGFWAAGVVVRYGTMVDFMVDKPWVRLIAGKVHNYLYLVIHTLPYSTTF